jgi:hypothetical protein
VGPACQRGKEEAGVPVQGVRCWAMGCFGGWANLVPLGPFLFSYFFSFSFSDFLIYSISFAYVFQIKSNHFQKFSKNQHIVPIQ